MVGDDEYNRQQRSGPSGGGEPSIATGHAKEPAGSNLNSIALADHWQQLRQFTQARIALGRVGTSLPTEEVLNFGFAHAMARDAVHLPLDSVSMQTALTEAGLDVVHVTSRAADRGTYLLRPDLGRRVDEAGLALLQTLKPQRPPDLLLVVGDGLSALAIHKHALPLIEEIRRQAPAGWLFGPVVMASQARVAIGDEIGAALGARMVAILIGERPGLSSPDSLGIYLTYEPCVGRHDAERNCISNVRLEGLSYTTAARKLLWLATTSMQMKQSGVGLKDESDRLEISGNTQLQLPV